MSWSAGWHDVALAYSLFRFVRHHAVLRALRFLDYRWAFPHLYAEEKRHICFSLYPQGFLSSTSVVFKYTVSEHVYGFFKFIYLFIYLFLQNLQWARDVLLGSSVPWQQLKHMPAQGLFCERNKTNLFNVSQAFFLSLPRSSTLTRGFITRER